MSYRQQRDYDGLWWQIALGIFVGQLMTAVLGGLGFLLLGGLVASQFSREIQISGSNRTTHRAAPNVPAHRPLSDDERCIQGKRFRRLSNGWQEMPHDPC